MRIEYRSPTVTEYTRLRELAGWWGTENNATEIALRHSLFSVVAVEKENVIGFGRIIGDGGLYFYIQDLIIHPDFQKRGFGKQLMNELMAYITINAKSGAFVGLMAAKGVGKYYEVFGFKARATDAPGMYLVIQ